MVALIKPLTSSTAKNIINAAPSNTATNSVALQTNGTSSIFVGYKAATGGIKTAASSITVGKFQIMDAVHEDIAAVTIAVNGEQQTSTGTALTLNNVTRGVAYVGASSALTSTAFWGGELVELLVYGTELTPAERSDAEGYLSYRYQLGTSQVTADPVFSLDPSILYTAPISIGITGNLNAKIYATTDGTTPTPALPELLAPISIVKTGVTTIKAIAVVNGLQSAVATKTYTTGINLSPGLNVGDTTPVQVNLQLPTCAIPQ